MASVEHALDLAQLLPERTFVTRDGVVVRGSIVEAAGTEVPGEGLFTVRRDLKAVGAQKDTLGERLAARLRAPSSPRSLLGRLRRG